jgi:hypothetical protein
LCRSQNRIEAGSDNFLKQFSAFPIESDKDAAIPAPIGGSDKGEARAAATMGQPAASARNRLPQAE